MLVFMLLWETIIFWGGTWYKGGGGGWGDRVHGAQRGPIANSVQRAQYY